MEKSTVRRWTGATMIAVTAALCAACAQPPSHPTPVIQDKIDRDVHLDGTWTGA